MAKRPACFHDLEHLKMVQRIHQQLLQAGYRLQWSMERPMQCLECSKPDSTEDHIQGLESLNDEKE